MKKLLLIILLTGSINIVYGWEINVTNGTSYTINDISVGRAACPTITKEVALKPGETMSLDMGSVCLMQTLYGNVLVTRKDPTGATPDRVDKVGFSGYNSTGQRVYKDFVIIGNLTSGFKAGRFVQ